MKQKIGIIGILVGLIGLLYAFKSGAFSSPKDAYVDMKLPDQVDYNFHIKPILSDNCYTCHGPDANKRKAGLRLDLAKNAYSELPESPGEFPIVVGKPNKSAIYEHIISENPDDLMPPPDSKLALNSYEKN
ncbi:c-type cytochrome domain-containing protein [Maribacter halichondriae]|uniref:c-type cytochrome domain-containing protein n=1 Tax=Maribacter halichondriae TaxID=2980554 RepID=UPI0023586515|nr:c-type cytochrome domain-containing protein [Maribacter sp. Hal144]